MEYSMEYWKSNCYFLTISSSLLPEMILYPCSAIESSICGMMISKCDKLSLSSNKVAISINFPYLCPHEGVKDTGI